MLVSVVQQNESAICTHMSPYPLPLEPPSHPPYPTSLGHRKAPNWSPCAMRLLTTSYFTFGSVDMLMLLSLRPSFPLPPRVLKSILYVYVFIPALQLGSSVTFFFFFFFRFHIYVLAYGIYFSLSDLLHSVWQTLGPSTSLQITQFHFFLWLSNIPLYICATSSLSIHLSMDI